MLAKLVNEEPTIPRDLAVMNMLRSMGIEKGKGFNPPKATAAILKEAISEAKPWMVNQLHVLITPYWKRAVVVA